MLTRFDCEHRLATTLLYLARKPGVRAETTLRISFKISQEELAQMVGTTSSRPGYFLKCFETQKMVGKDPKALVVREDRVLDYLLSCP